MNLLKDYPQLQIIQSLATKKQLKIYLVGGFVRDFLLGRPGGDFDFAVSRDAIRLAQEFSRKVKGAFILLDEEHGCARVALKKSGNILTFDFADFRAKTLRGDLSARDFSINALSVDFLRLKNSDAFEKLIQDPSGGKEDIKKKKIRMVSPKAFLDDPLRLLRGFSLQAMLDFKIEAKTLAQIKKDRELIRDVSAERVRDEIFKILVTPSAFKNFKLMDNIGLLENVMPQIKVMFTCRQGGYHHLDVWPHSLETMNQLEQLLIDERKDPEIAEYLDERISGTRNRTEILKLAALLHDIGKPDTQKIEPEGKMSFHGHEHVGRNIVHHISNMLKLSVQERHMLEDMVRWHLRPGYLSNFKNPSERSIFRYFRDTKEEAISILLLSLADQRSTRGPLTSEKDQAHHEDIIRRLIKIHFERKNEKPFVRLINGRDLIKHLKLKPSPIFAKILKEVEEEQVLGKIKTKKEALQLAKKFI